MKYIAVGLVAATLTLMSATAALADGNQRNYLVQSGDTLWDIAEAELGSPWCWPLIAGIPENNLDYQGLLLAGDTLVLPSVEDCDVIVNPLSVEFPMIDETVVAILPSGLGYLKGFTLGDYVERAYGDLPPFQSYSKYDDKKVNDRSFLYRERDGNTWYVVRNGVRGQAWDFVDHVLRNNATGSVFYRARDIRGEWYVVKNEIATKLSFEPKELYLNTANDEVFAFSPAYTSWSENPETHLWSTFEEWTIPVKAVPVAVDRAGHVLFRERSKIVIRTKASDGMDTDVCNSSICSFDDTYWMNGKRIATTSSRMIPMYSEKDPAAKLPFWFDRHGTEKTYKHYGAFGRPTFDAAGNLSFHVVRDSLLTKMTFDTK